MADIEFYTLVADLQFGTLVTDDGFWTLVADFRFWTLVANFERERFTISISEQYSKEPVNSRSEV